MTVHKIPTFAHFIQYFPRAQDIYAQVQHGGIQDKTMAYRKQKEYLLRGIGTSKQNVFNALTGRKD